MPRSARLGQPRKGASLRRLSGALPVLGEDDDLHRSASWPGGARKRGMVGGWVPGDAHADSPLVGCKTDWVLRAYQPPTLENLQWVTEHVHPHARVAAVVPLPGGITADMDRVSVESPTGLEDVVLRRWRDEEWAEGLVAREAAALAAVRGHGVPAPRLLAMDEDGSETGVQCTLTSALTGHPDLSPTDMQSWLDQLATTQAAIHAVPNHPPARWHRWSERSRPLDWLADPRAAERRPTGGRGATSRGGGAGARRLPAL